MTPEDVAAMLKPCPFCGGKALYIEVKPEMIQSFLESFAKGLKAAGVEVPPVPSLDDMAPHATSSCPECNYTMTKNTALEIVRAWNFRPEENRLKELAKASHCSLSAQVRIWEERAIQAGYVGVEPEPAASLAPEWEPDGDCSEVD